MRDLETRNLPFAYSKVVPLCSTSLEQRGTHRAEYRCSTETHLEACHPYGTAELQVSLTLVASVCFSAPPKSRTWFYLPLPPLQALQFVQHTTRITGSHKRCTKVRAVAQRLHCVRNEVLGLNYTYLALSFAGARALSTKSRVDTSPPATLRSQVSMV
jgi:hypothetical protein